MGGFQKLIFRICPIIMLICCVCLGITHIFGRTDEDNEKITYLNDNIVIVQEDNPNTPDINEEIRITNYTFEFDKYREAITTNSVIKDSLLNTIDLETFKENINQYNILWDNGYQALDILKTIANTFVLLINGLLTITNVIIAPFRLGGAILLTGMSLIGININRNKGIVKLLKTISLYAVIDLIGTTQEEVYDALSGKKFYFNNNITITQGQTLEIEATFIANEKTYNKLTISNTDYTGGTKVTYYDSVGGYAEVYSMKKWHVEPNRIIQFSNNNFTDHQCEVIENSLQPYTYELIDNTIWQFRDTINPTNTTYNVQFTTRTEVGKYIKFSYVANDGLWYTDADNNDVKVYDYQNGWIYQDAKSIRFLTQDMNPTTNLQLKIFMTSWAVQQR